MKSKILIITDRLLKLAISFLTGVMAAKAYGADGYGDLSFALAFCAVLSTISLLGIESVVIREISRDLKKSAKIIGSLKTLLILSSNMVFIGGIFLLYLITYDALRLSVSVIVLSSLLTHFLYPSLLLAQANNNFTLISIASILSTLVVTLARIIILVNKVSIEYYALTYPFELALNYLILYFCVIRREKINFSIDLNILISLGIFRDGWKLLFSALVMVLLSKIDQIIIGIYLNSYSLGVYAIAYRIIDAALTVPFALLLLHSTRIYESHYKDKLSYLSIISNLSRLCFVYALLFVIFTFTLGDKVIVYIFGESFIDSSEILKILCFNVLFLSYGQLLHYMAISAGQEMLIMKKILWTLPVYLIVLFIGVSNFGVTGAAVASVFMYFFSAIFLTFLLPRQRPMISFLITSLYCRSCKNNENRINNYDV